MADEKIEVENVNVPGHITRVDRAKFEDMKQAMIATMPKAEPGFTAKDIKDHAIPKLDPNLFPAGKTSGWWAKTVQLDMEAKGELTRLPTKPLRWYLT